MRRFRHKLLCEALEDRWNPSRAWAGPTDHIDCALVQLYTTGGAPDLEFDSEGRVGVRVTSTNVSSLAPQLQSLNFAEMGRDENFQFIEGWLPVTVLPAAEVMGETGQLGGVVAIRGGTTNSGAVTSEAVHTLHSAFVNSKSSGGLTGAGIKIGVISDSYNLSGLPVNGTFSGAAADIATDDLPPTATFLVEGPSIGSNTDEGRAMMQLVYDIAPGSTPIFSAAGSSESAMKNSIDNLVSQGCKVIVDDWTFYQEPYYQDGVITQAYDAAVAAGVVCLTSAGNFANNGYDSTSFPTTSDTFAPGSQFFDFNPGGGGDSRNTITIPAGGTFQVSAHWDNPYGVGKVQSDLDLYLVYSGTNSIAGSPAVNNNVASGNPSEYLSINNNTPSPCSGPHFLDHRRS